MAKKRDYKTEYARRIARGKARGLSRSQARGHPRQDETPIKPTALRPLNEEKISQALQAMYAGTSLTAAAKSAHVSPDRLKRALVAKKLGIKEGRRWIVTDARPRRVQIIVDAKSKAIIVPTFADASRVGVYRNRVRRFLDTHDLTYLEEFEGETVTDINGKSWPLETDPNMLIRFALKDEPAFHEIYQIVEP